MASDALEALLRSGPEFTAWRQGQDDEIDLENVDLSGRTIIGADLSSVNLKAARLAGTRFVDSRLDEAVLYQADARDAEFRRCHFKSVYASQIKLTGARFWQCRLEEARLLRSDLTDVSFEHSALFRCQFDESNLGGARFPGCLLVDNSFPRSSIDVQQNKTGRTETHLEFYWISDSGDDFALGPLEEGHPYAASLRRYQRRESDVIKQFARMAAAVIRKHHRLTTSDMLVPVPPLRPSEESYANAMLARELWSLTGMKDGTNWLVRHTPIPHSADAYVYRDSLATSASVRADRRILLIDDVATDAALDACRQLLQEAGVRQVLSLSLARQA